jgi:branched-subunit amino acid aminotransferase/4-amino-4-deoxychorismate lyase
MLDRHLDRFLRSMATARVPAPFDRATLRAIILRTAAASGRGRPSRPDWFLVVHLYTLAASCSPA